MNAINCRLQGLPSSHGKKRAIRGSSADELAARTSHSAGAAPRRLTERKM